MLEAKNKIGKRSQIYAFAMQNVTNIRGMEFSVLVSIL